jgi:hypothetical protein
MEPRELGTLLAQHHVSGLNEREQVILLYHGWGWEFELLGAAFDYSPSRTRAIYGQALDKTIGFLGYGHHDGLGAHRAEAHANCDKDCLLLAKLFGENSDRFKER